MREQRLLRRYARFGDQAAREELVERFLPLAASVARRYQRAGEPLDDLVQVASIGLLKALDRFDPERGFEFSSYAVPTILGELKRHFRDYGWAMHVPRSDQELVLSVNRATEQVAGRLGRSPTAREIAVNSRLTVEEVIRGHEAGLASRPGSLDAAMSSSEGAPAPSSWLAHEERGFEEAGDRDAVSQALAGLSPREHSVLYMRFFEELTQSQIAARIGVSQMHVSRILRAALERAGRAAAVQALPGAIPASTKPQPEEEACSSQSQSSC